MYKPILRLGLGVIVGWVAKEACWRGSRDQHRDAVNCVWNKDCLRKIRTRDGELNIKQ